MTTTKEHTVTPTLYDLIGDDPTLVPGLRAWLSQHEEEPTKQQQSAGGPSFRAEAGEAAAEPTEDDGAEGSECAHGVLTSTEAAALTCGNVRAPDSQTESVEERADQRTTCAPRYSTDPNQPLRDLKRRTRRDLAAEVRRLRRECAKTRRKLRDAEDRLTDVEETRRG
ncbi:hypothetical protein ACTXJ9_03185 [Brachybacterium tyrofermentans]|uniref:hypothetical protein n=1 Tax=Brachybacterium tyrofermentans TaxID=47848 RepID=UPI003FCF796A